MLALIEDEDPEVNDGAVGFQSQTSLQATSSRLY
jgi:hypothetical protein